MKNKMFDYQAVGCLYVDLFKTIWGSEVIQIVFPKFLVSIDEFSFYDLRESDEGADADQKF